jgi:hypothetical protein
MKLATPRVLPTAALLALVGASLAGVIAAALLSIHAVRAEHRWDALTGPATWGLALATLFSGAAIYLGFAVNAQEQHTAHRVAQVREAAVLLNRFRKEPWLVFFVLLIDWESIGPRRLAVPPEAQPLVGPTIHYDPADLAAFLNEQYTTDNRELLSTYSDAFNIGLDYLTEVALMVENGIIPYQDLSTLAHFLEMMRRPNFADGALLRYLRKYRYNAVQRLLERDPALISR